MFIQRKLLPHFISWQVKKRRKPLIVRGARQVGKTSVITHFGKTHFKNYVVLNFENEAHVRRIFETQNDVREILKQIEVYKNTTIRPEETLLFLDEIQACPAAIGRLRYFFEEIPQYPVIAAGSLLEFTLDDEIRSFPVGRVEFLYLFPLNFSEFLQAIGEEKLHDYLSTVAPDQKIPEALHAKFRQHLRDFFLVGGMPEAVATFCDTGSIQQTQSVMNSLMQTLQEDFRKYRTRFDPYHLEFIFQEITKWIGKRINFTKLGGAELTPTQVTTGMRLLQQAMLIHWVHPVSSLKFPLHKKSRVHPKMVFLDLGLAQVMNRISQEIITTPSLSSIYQGGLAEQFVSQEILTSLAEQGKPEMFFWTSENKKSVAEIDLLLPLKASLIPVEIKSGEGGRLASLHQFNFLHSPRLSLRVYDGPLTQEKVSVLLPTQEKISYPLLSIPLYLTNQIFRLIKNTFGD